MEKYKVGDKVMITGRKAIIVATSKTPHKPTFDVYNRTEIYAEKDYLIYYFDKIENDKEIYLGTNDVYENQVENFGW